LTSATRQAARFDRVLQRVEGTVALVLQRGQSAVRRAPDAPAVDVATRLPPTSAEVRRLRQWCVTTPGVQIRWRDDEPAPHGDERLRFRIEVSDSVNGPGCLRPFLLGLRQLEGLRRLERELEETNRGILALYKETLNQKLQAGEASRQLRDLNARKDEFLAMLAHELRNPLAAMHAATTELSGAAPDEADGLREVMRRQLGLLERLVDDLLDVSRITRGRLVLDTQPVDLRLALRDATATMHHAARAKDVRLECSEPEAPVIVDGDAARLVQVAVNLLDNAIKYTEPPGWIRAHVEGAEGTARLVVADSGRGFNPVEAERLFELFVQDVDSEQAPAGLGLGLTLVRSLVDLHGGRIVAASPGVGRGSRFVVELPRLADAAIAPTAGSEPAEPAATAGPAARAARDLAVLLVEDHDDLRTIFAAKLRRHFARVDEAATGPEALAALEGRPDVVILDLGLPGFDGLEVARRLRASGSEARLVALTGHGAERDREASKAAGFDHHLVKPVEPEAIVQLLEEGRP